MSSRKKIGTVNSTKIVSSVEHEEGESTSVRSRRRPAGRVNIRKESEDDSKDTVNDGTKIKIETEEENTTQTGTNRKPPAKTVGNNRKMDLELEISDENSSSEVASSESEEVTKSKSKRRNNDESERKNSIKIRLECSSIRTAFEILISVSPNICHFRFTKNGFTISAVSKPKEKKRKSDETARQTCELEYSFQASDISKYKYNLVNEHKEPIVHYETSVNTEKFHQQIKGLKKGCLNICIDVSTQKGVDDVMLVIVPGSVRTVETSSTSDRNNKHPKILEFSRHFTKADPCAKPFSSVLETLIGSSKNSKCAQIEFIHFPETGNMMICGWSSSNSNIATFQGSLDSKEEDSSYEEDDEDLHSKITRTIYVEQNDWIYKMPKLSLSVINIYMIDDDSPIAFKTYIGCQGTATFTIKQS